MPKRSAWLTTIVLALGMSRPFSMMVVQTSTSVSPWEKRSMASSSSSPFMLPCAMSITAPGNRRAISSASSVRPRMRSDTTNACPSRFSSRSRARCTSVLSNGAMMVCTGSRSSGGDVM